MEVGVLGRDGNEPDVGDSSAELSLAVELVPGRKPSFGGWKALKTRDFAGRLEALSPKEAESRLIYLASEVDCGIPVNT